MKSEFLLPLILLVASFTLVVAQTEPQWEHPRYYSECWRGAEAYAADGWTTDVYPDTGLFAECSVMPNEPIGAYPYHSGIVKGVSDTTIIYVEFHNRNQTGYNISSVSPETWFTPVLWPVGLDKWKMPPLTLPATFGWRFEYWLKNLELPSTKPASIPSEYDIVSGYSYSLVFYCWGLPAGRYQLMMKKTGSAPSSFKLLKGDVTPVWITMPTSLADTISAYAACFYRAFDKRNKSACSYWANRILNRNPFSISGYWLRANQAAFPPPDTLTYFASVDSALAIINRYGDPLLPDSANMTGWVKTWYEDRKNGFAISRYESQTGQHRQHL